MTENTYIDGVYTDGRYVPGPAEREHTRRVEALADHLAAEGDEHGVKLLTAAQDAFVTFLAEYDERTLARMLTTEAGVRFRAVGVEVRDGRLGLDATIEASK